MGIISEISDQIPKLKEYLSYIFEKKRTNTIGNNLKILSFNSLRAELFNPQKETNQSAYTIVLDLAFQAVTSLLSELHNKNKAIVGYLSSTDGRATLGKVGNNDNAECPFGAFTWAVQKNGTIGLGHAGRMAQARINGDFDQGYKRFMNPKDGSKNQSSDVAM
eukprot:13581277-Ditylum_brightwellii.AAC.1